ncbi:MAG TPA: penicillin-binding protein 2 [Acidimicrobiales bacterium]|nr:penicillin-binding protein 2 [Acidimicrobiales bacterium]
MKADTRSQGRADPGRRVVDRTRLGIIGLMVFSLFTAMFVRLWYLQVLNAPQFQQAAVSNQVRQVSVAAPRGLVLDRTGQVMVGNKTTVAVTLERVATAAEQLKQAPVIAKLADLLQVTPSSIAHTINDVRYSPYEPVPIATNVPMSAIVYIEEHKDEFPGVKVEELSERAYPMGDTASQVLGYDTQISSTELAKLGSKGYQAGDLVGAAGVEGAYESYLRGQPGVTDLSVNAHGQVTGTVGGQAPSPGDNVQLTVDAGLQQELDKDLAGEINTLHTQLDPYTGNPYPAPDGAAVVLDPNNGQVLAMSSYPSYDPSVWQTGQISQAQWDALSAPSAYQPLENRAIFGSWAPGSTFKLATATAALNDGLLTPSTIIDDPGIFQFPNCHGDCPVLHNDVSDGALGPLDITQALIASDDVFFYTLGYRFWAAGNQYGPEPIQTVAHGYGLGVPTHFALGDSSYSWVDSPTVRKTLHAQAPKVYPDSWYAADNVEMAFGQGLTVITPLQLADAYATFANGGTLYQPQIAARALDRSGKVIKSFDPKVIDKVPMSDQDRQAMLAGFEGVTTNPRGTAYGTFEGFPFDKMTVAGKTGTADTSSTAKEPTSLFVAFAPVDHPQYVVAVVIDQAGYGASGSAPVARQILQYLIDHPVTSVANPPPVPGVTTASANAQAAATGSGQAPGQ